MSKDRFGKKSAVLEHRRQVALTRRNSRQALKRSPVLIPEAGKVVSDLRLGQTASSSRVMLSPGRNVPD
ncbi:MAG: hypothetical protein RIQ93_2832 [Verrucomicrobiota bacterium]|jgi:hypothetical protein